MREITKIVLALAIVGSSSTQTISQDTGLLDTLPTTKEEFAQSEPTVLHTIDWLENTPLNQEVDKRKLLSARFLAWLTNSPMVTITLDAKVTPFFKKNPDLIMIFMGGWTKYTLQNSYSKDAVKCNLAGVKSAIRFYQMGNGIKKDKEIEKLIEMDSRNELEAWVERQLGQK
jgi:hypothetical protein